MNNSGTGVLNGPLFNSVTIFEQWGLTREMDSYLKLVNEVKLKITFSLLLFTEKGSSLPKFKKVVCDMIYSSKNKLWG